MATGESTQTAVVLSTAIISILSGFLLGVYSIRGYLIPPALVEERRKNFKDPVESDESDIDEDESILDHAPNWTNGADADRSDGLRARKEKRNDKANDRPDGQQQPALPGLDSNEECKLVLVVRTDLGMTKGKIAAQCSHATLACYKRLSRETQRDSNSLEARILRRWEQMGQAKIAVQVKSQDDILQLMGVARSLGVTAEVISDAGRTQIEAGSLTVLGVGPAPKSVVNQITGHLKLL